jgi:RNA polymerase sigma-70 factor (ECF subfamily)
MVAKASGLTVSRIEADDRLLVEAAQKDPTRFGELYEINFNLVYAYISKRVGDRDLAEDLTSEVFHRALANLARFEWRGAPFAAWLLRIASNAIADRAKSTSQERKFYCLDEAGLSEPSDIDLEATEQRAQLFGLVEELPADQRRVIAMRFAEQKSIREIAQELGRTEGAVKQLQFRGLEKLRAQMGETNG